MARTDLTSSLDSSASAAVRPFLPSRVREVCEANTALLSL